MFITNKRYSEPSTLQDVIISLPTLCVDVIDYRTNNRSDWLRNAITSWLVKTKEYNNLGKQKRVHFYLTEDLYCDLVDLQLKRVISSVNEGVRLAVMEAIRKIVEEEKNG